MGFGLGFILKIALTVAAQSHAQESTPFPDQARFQMCLDHRVFSMSQGELETELRARIKAALRAANVTSLTQLARQAHRQRLNITARWNLRLTLQLALAVNSPTFVDLSIVFDANCKRIVRQISSEPSDLEKSSLNECAATKAMIERPREFREEVAKQVAYICERYAAESSPWMDPSDLEALGEDELILSDEVRAPLTVSRAVQDTRARRGRLASMGDGSGLAPQIPTPPPVPRIEIDLQDCMHRREPKVEGLRGTFDEIPSAAPASREKN